MEIRDYARTLRKRWRLVALFTLIAIGAAAVLVWRSTPKYEATTQLFVTAKDTSGEAANLNAGGQFTQQRVQSYADIINSPAITGPVASQLGGGLTAAAIAAELSASAPLNTVLVNLSVRDPSAQRAQAIANGVSDEFAKYAAQLETPPGSSVSPVKVTVVKRASLPTSPVSPRKRLDLLLGLLIGLIVGVAAAVTRETLDTTVKDPDAIRAAVDLPVLGAIAYDPEAPKRPLIVQADPRSSRSETFRQLRTNLQFVDIDHAPRSIVITSSVPEEGKTTTVTNLAIALAESGLRILLVEADLRRPRMADYLGVEGAVGLTSVLIGQTDLATAIQSWGREGHLRVLASGPTPPNPSELLGSQGMVDLLRELELSYDLVLVDAPPLLPVTDAAVLGTATSGTVVVTRYGKTKTEQLARAVESLRAVEAHIYGVVLTMTPRRGPDAYYYGYGYRYEHEANRRARSARVNPPPRGVRRLVDSPAETSAGPVETAAPTMGATVLPGHPTGNVQIRPSGQPTADSPSNGAAPSSPPATPAFGGGSGSYPADEASSPRAPSASTEPVTPPATEQSAPATNPTWRDLDQ